MQLQAREFKRGLSVNTGDPKKRELLKKKKIKKFNKKKFIDRN
jgi:hypothetical protein